MMVRCLRTSKKKKKMMMVLSREGLALETWLLLLQLVLGVMRLMKMMVMVVERLSVMMVEGAHDGDGTADDEETGADDADLGVG